MLLTANQQNVFEKLDGVDFNFEGATTQYSTHKFHPYPARFIPQIPKTFIELLTKEGDTILDPMCGCGTSLVEAFLMGRKGIGNDMNPLACLISKVKTTLIQEKEFNYLEKEITRDFKVSKTQIKNFIKNLPKRKIRNYFTGDKISKLEGIKKLLLEIKEEHFDLYDLCRVALSSVIWSFIESKGTLDIKDAFFKKINMMKKEFLNIHCRGVLQYAPTTIIHGDSRNLQIENGCVDLIVTSPPYVNALDYYREHMFNMHFLDMDFGLFKKNEIGGHSHFISNRFRLLSEYLGDMLRSMIEMNRVLKQGKFCVIVVGNSTIEYESIESHKFFTSFAKDTGFKHHRTFSRKIDTTKKYTSKNIGKINQEYIVVLEKITDSHHSSNDDNFVSSKVRSEMESFKEEKKIKKKKHKLNEAIALVDKDIIIKT